MRISKLPIFKTNSTNRNIPKSFGASYPNLSPLKQDTVSFKGTVLKKSDFKGTDLAVIEKYKPNIQQFKSKEDLQTFAENEFLKLRKTDFKGRQPETIVQRRAMLQEWMHYVIKENDAYSNVQKLIILSAITKDLKPNNDTIPPVLNKGALAQTVTELEEKLKANPKENFDFNKMYQNNLRTSFMKDSATGETMTGWIVIPSEKNDPENFEKNEEKLKTISHKSWCTKSLKAETYLSEGDFHVYLENGQPKLGVRFVGDKVKEIQGERNNGKIPPKYFKTFEAYKKKNKFAMCNSAEYQFKEAVEKQKQVEIVKNKLGEKLKLKTIDDANAILNQFSIPTKITKDGIVITDDYRCYNSGLWFDDIGINENDLFKFIYKIEGDAIFGDKNVTHLGNLHSIGGDAYFRFSQVMNLGNLKEIKRGAFFSHSSLTDLGKLEKIGGEANFSNSKIQSLGNLKEIGEDANFRNSQVNNLGNLKSILGNAEFYNSKITSLENLEKIGKNADFVDSKVKDLGKLKLIGGEANFRDSKIQNLGKLEKIGGCANFAYSKITNLGELKEIGENAYFSGSVVNSLNKLKKIGGNAYFDNSKLNSLGALEKIGKTADFSYTRIRNLGNLKYIGEYAVFIESKIENLKNLEYIGGRIYIENSKLKREDFEDRFDDYNMIID